MPRGGSRTHAPRHVDARRFSLTRHVDAGTSKWIADVRAQRGSDVVLVLVGNKTDLGDKREARRDHAEIRRRGHAGSATWSR